MRVHFNDLFWVSEDGITPRVPIQIGVYVLSPEMGKNSHVDLRRYAGMDVCVVADRVTQRQVILGFYTDENVHKAPVEYPVKANTFLSRTTQQLLRMRIMSFLPF